MTTALRMDTLDLIAPVDQVQKQQELASIRSAEVDLDKAYNDAQFWNKIADIFYEATIRDYSKDNSIESAITSSAHYL